MKPPATCYLLTYGSSNDWFVYNSCDSPLACLAGETRSLARSIDPLEVSGSEVSNMTGVEVSHLRVISSRNGKL